MKTTLIALVLVAYAAVGVRLTAAAERFKINPKAGVWWNSLGDPSNFSPEGEPLRRRAVQYYWSGLVVVLVIIALINWL